MLFPNNFYKDQYLSNYDLITKYNLTSIYDSPKIKSVVLEFSLADFLKGYDFNKLRKHRTIIIKTSLIA